MGESCTNVTNMYKVILQYQKQAPWVKIKEIRFLVSAWAGFIYVFWQYISYLCSTSIFAPIMMFVRFVRWEYVTIFYSPPLSWLHIPPGANLLKYIQNIDESKDQVNIAVPHLTMVKYFTLVTKILMKLM